MDFWERVCECKHKNLYPDYFEFISCGTPYCSGNETHCMDCGVFITDCGCHWNMGMSGWSEARWRKERQKGNKRRWLS